jgi:CHAT domain-containing protein
LCGGKRGRQPIGSGFWPVLLASALAVVGCHRSIEPDALFESAYADYLHSKFATASELAQQGISRFAASGSKSDSEWSLKFRLLAAEILIDQDRELDALTILTGQPIPDASWGDMAIKWKLLCALAHRRAGQQELAEHELAEAREAAVSARSRLMADVLWTEGLALRSAGNFDEADQKFRSSLTALGDHDDVLLKANILVDLAFNCQLRDRYSESLDWSIRAIGYARPLQATRQLEMALGNAGWAYQNLGDFDRALVTFQEADQRAQEIGLIRHRSIWLQNTGLAEYRLGDLQKAKEYEEQALRSALTLPHDEVSDEVVNIESNLALLLLEQSSYAAARHYIDAAMLATQDSKAVNVIAYTRYLQGLLASRQQNTDDAVNAMTAARQLATDPDLRTDIEHSLADLYYTKGQTEQAQIWYGRAIQTFEAKRSAVSDEALRLSAFSYGESVYRDYADLLIQTHKSQDALQLLDRSRSRTLEEGLSAAGVNFPKQDGSPSDPQAVARSLRSTVLFYSLSREKSHLWAITASQTRLIDLPPEREIRALLKKHQTDIQQSADPLHQPNSAAASLYDALVKPAADLIAPDSRVVIIPDGDLRGLNYETLVVQSADSRKYWIEDVTLSTASSIRMLSAPKSSKSVAATQKDLLLIGDTLPPSRDFAPLPDAAAEIQRIRQHFPAESQVVLAKNQAIPSAYSQSAPEQFRYIHFAAHGTASQLTPLDSAIVLSPSGGEAEDFKLYARDIVRHPINAELVTISACYGSGVRNYAGEGLVGLAWVFLRAGSHEVIAALWQVADAASPMLMDRLYDGLRAGKPPDAALRDAKLALLHSSGIYRKPLFWGAFQLYAGS